jgi:hypothetical protein
LSPERFKVVSSYLKMEIRVERLLVTKGAPEEILDLC